MASGAPLRHGSHPGHAFEALVPFETFHCSICKGCDNAAESTWYRCCQPACGYTLCPKCFEVDEVLFSSVEVVIRNPQLAYDDLRYVVRTRPRESAHILAPIYAGRLMEVVSTAVSTEDPTQSYFRMRHGGWINTAHVLCVVPAERHMAKLANLHFRGQYVSRGGATALGRLSSSILIECVKESMTLVDLNSPHGVPMAALTIYPLLNVVSRAPNYAVEDDNEEVTVAELTTEVLRFLYFFLHYTMGHILDALDRKQRIECGVALSLYADLLGGCILAALDLSQRWGVLLPAPFGPLIMCAITVWSKLWMQLPPTDETSDYSSLRLRQPAVIIVHVALSSENARLRQFFSWMMENTSRLLMRGVEGERAWGFPYLREIRAHLIHSKSEVLAKAFAEMAYNVMVQESPEKRSRIFDTDPLEVIVRLAKSAELAESQIAALRLVGVMASDCHESVGVLAAVVLGPIMAMCDHAAQSPAVVIAALHCFAQLSGHSVEPTAPLWDGVCSKSAHTRPAAYQYLFSYTLHNGRSVALCAHCASQHPPEEAVVKDEGASVAYFACQCPCCSRGGGACGEPTINVAPAITTTAGGAAVPAGQDLCNNEVVAAFRRGNMSAWLLRCLDQYASNAAVLNAVGRFILHCPNVSEEVVARLVWLLVGLPNVAQFHEAAMAIAARTDLPCVSQKLRMLPDSALTLYALDPYHRHLTATLKMEPSLSNTPVGPSSRPSEGGLSPSPAPSSMYRSSGSMQYRSSSTNNTNPNRASSSSYQPPPAGLMERVFSGNYALEC